MRLSTRTVLAVAVVAACFSGDGTMGAYCDQAADCGPAQSCSNSVCGRCADEKIQPGELCFGDSTEYFVGGQPRAMISNDIDGDGDLDLIAPVNLECGPLDMRIPCFGVAILGGDGEGGFTASVPGEGDASPGIIAGIELASFGGSPAKDAVLFFEEFPALIVALDLAEGGDMGGEIALAFTPTTVVPADFDLDGKDDIVVGDPIGVSTVLYLRGLGGAEFADPVFSEGEGTGSTRLYGPMDLDGDDAPDVIALLPETGVLEAFLGRGDGTFVSGGLRDFGPSSFPFVADFGDINGDGAIDVAVIVAGDTNVAIAYGRGDGEFDTPNVLPGGTTPTGVAVNDMNSDDMLDVLVTDLSSDKLGLWINRDGDFPDSIALDASLTPIFTVRADFNDDGAPELAVASAVGVISILPADP